MRYIELLMLFAAVLAPQFFFANSIGNDEFIKGGSGVALGGVVVAAYRLWRKHDD